MKALLSQWIGGLKQGSLSAQKTDSKGKVQDTDGVENQAFIGVMMGSLGMEQNTKAPAEKVAMSNSQGEKKVQNATDTSVQRGTLEPKKLTDGLITTADNGETKTAEGKSSAGSKHAKANNVESRKAQMHSATGDAAKVGNTDGKAVGANEEITEGKGEKKESTSTKIAQTEQSGKQASLNAAVKNTASNVNAGNVATTQGEGIQEKSGSDLHSSSLSNSAKESMVNDKNGLLKTDGNDRQNHRNGLRPGASPKQALQREISTNTTIKNDAQAAMKEFKALQKESDETKARAGQNTSGRGSVTKLQSMAQSAQNSGVPSLRSDSDPVKPMPGKMMFSPSTHPVDTEIDMNTPKEFKEGLDNIFKEVHINELKSAQLSEAAGRKSFSRQLTQTSRQQLAQARTSSQETTQWKHHRFMLEDGKAIHVAARTTDGTLQLHLNAGKGELGKILHQHLQDIQQHVQQELEIKIDLQLQDFSGQQPDQQAETPKGSKQVGQQPSSGDGALNAEDSPAFGRRQVRYLGFNNNEWTA